MEQLLTKEQITYLNSLDSKTAKHKFLLDCLVEKFSLGKSEEFKKPPLEYNHWIKNDEDPKWLIYFDKNNKKRYGFDSYGNWFESLVCYNPNAEKGSRYASAKEVETALISEGKNRGYENCIVVNSFIDNKELEIIEDNKIQYLGGYYDKYHFFQKNTCNVLIYKKGTWAEIIENPTDLGNSKPNYSPEEIDLVKHNINQREVSEKDSELLKFDKLEEDTKSYEYCNNIINFSNLIIKCVNMESDPTNILMKFLLNLNKYSECKTRKTIPFIDELFPINLDKNNETAK